MKRKIALLLTMTMLAGSVYTPMMVEAAVSDEEQQILEDWDDGEIRASEDTENEETDTAEASVEDMQEEVFDAGEEIEDMQPAEEEAGTEEDDGAAEETENVETMDDGLEFDTGDAEDASADSTAGVWNDLEYEVKDGKATILGVIYDEHKDKSGTHVIKKDRCRQTDGNVPSSINGYPVVAVANRAYSDCINITSVKIPETVKEIGSGAFAGCTSLRSISIPDNGLTVCAAAFQGCTALNSVHIPASVQAHPYIGQSPAYNGVFAGCTALRNVTFGKGITKVPRGFFQNCNGLLSINIPDSVTEVEPKAFRGCTNLKDVHLSGKLQTIGDSAFANCKSLTMIKLPSTLTTLRGSAFSGSSLTEINIPKNMKTEEYTASNKAWGGPFTGVTTLKKVTFDEGTEEIPRGIFYSPGSVLGIEQVVFPDSVKRIGYRAFVNCSNIGKITLPKNLEFIDTEAFLGCSSLKLSQKELPKKLTTIYGSAFNGCTSLEAVVLPDAITFLGGLAFGSCSGLTEINIPASLKTNERESGPFADCANLKKIIWGSGITEIPDCIFHKCTGLESVELPSTVKKIGYYAFMRCTNLKEVKFSDKLTDIWSSAFEGCTSLKEIKLPDSLEYADWKIFRGCTSLEKVTFPNKAKLGRGEIAASCFSGCSSLKNATIPAAVTYLNPGIFSDVSSDFAIYGYDGSYAQSYAKDNSLAFVSLGTAERTSFKITFNKNAKKATLKTMSKTLKTNSKYGTLPTPSYSGYYFLGWYTKASGGSKVTASTVFRGKSNQTLYAHWAKADLSKATVKVSKSSVTWNGKAQKPGVTVKFYGNTLKKNTHYTVSYSSNKEPGKATVTIKGKGLFGKTKKTAKFTINKASRTLSASNVVKSKSNKGKTFTITVKIKGNSGVDKTKPTFKSGNTSVATVKGDKVTLNKTGYSEVTVTAPATKHYKATSKKILAVLQGTQSITLNCAGLKKDKAADTYIAANDILAKSLGVKTLDGAQAVCTVSSVSGTADALMGQGDKLTAKGKGTVKIKIETKTSKHQVYPPISKMITVKLNGFPISGKTWGYSQNSNGTVTLTKYYGNGAKVNVPSSIKINNVTKKVTALGDGLFKKNTTITTVTLPDSLTKIGASAFEGCTKLTALEIPDTVTGIGASAFSGCTSLKMIRIPNGVTSISDNMMKNCRSMKGELYLPSGLTSVGAGAFQGCTGITKVHVFGYLKKIAQNAFAGCSGISSAAYAGTKRGWAKISWAAGNEVLKNLNNIQYYIYGPSDTYGDVGMTDGEFISQHPDSLQNTGISKITNELEDETYKALSSVSTLQIWASAFKSQLDAGKPDYKAMMENLTGVTYSEDQLNKTIALEMLQNMSGEEWNTFGKNEEALISTIYGFFGENKALRDEFLSNGNKRWAFARDLAKNTLLGKTIGASEMNDCLKKINDNWSKIQKVYSTVGAGIDTYEFVVSWLIIMQSNYDQIQQLMQLVPQDSGLHTGLTILERWYSRNLSEIAVDYMTEASLKALAKVNGKLVNTVVDEIWKGHRLTASSYILIASIGFRCVGKIVNTPTISDYNKAWLSVCNTKVLKLRMEQLRWQLANGQNNESTRSKFILTCKAYFASLRQQIKYASNTLPKEKAKDLNFRFKKYEPGLNYTSYMKATIAQYQDQ